MLKGKRFFDIEDIKSSVKGILADIPVQDFKKTPVGTGGFSSRE
jgi:hypothetical protein